jgi:hypothetical protein
MARGAWRMRAQVSAGPRPSVAAAVRLHDVLAPHDPTQRSQPGILHVGQRVVVLCTAGTHDSRGATPHEIADLHDACVCGGIDLIADSLIRQYELRSTGRPAGSPRWRPRRWSAGICSWQRSTYPRSWSLCLSLASCRCRLSWYFA